MEVLRILTRNGRLRLDRPGCFPIPRRECPPVPKSQKIINLALSPAVILGRARIDAGIDADVENQGDQGLGPGELPDQRFARRNNMR